MIKIMFPYSNSKDFSSFPRCVTDFKLGTNHVVIKWKGEAGISTLASVIKSAIYSAHTNLVRDAGVGDFHKSGRGSKN